MCEREREGEREGREKEGGEREGWMEEGGGERNISLIPHGTNKQTNKHINLFEPGAYWTKLEIVTCVCWIALLYPTS